MSALNSAHSRAPLQGATRLAAELSASGIETRLIRYDEAGDWSEQLQEDQFAEIGVRAWQP